MKKELPDDFWVLHKNMNCGFPLKEISGVAYGKKVFNDNSLLTIICWDFVKIEVAFYRCSIKKLFHKNHRKNTDLQPAILLRNSHRRSSVRKGFIRNFAKFTGKHLCQSLFQASACSFVKKEALAKVFSREFCEVFKKVFLTEHLRRTASVYLKSFFIHVNFVKSLKIFYLH